MKLTTNIEELLPGSKDEVCLDEDSHNKRKKVLGTAKYNSIFFGMNQVLTFMSGILASVGIGLTMMGIKEFKDANIAKGAELTFNSLMATDLGGMGLAIVAAAAATTALAVGAHQISSRVAHSVSYDQSEINAQHTAKYLAKAIKQELEGVQTKQAEPQPVQVGFANNARADGKPWAQYLDERMAANPNVQR